jgi:hypothetical protein
MGVDGVGGQSIEARKEVGNSIPTKNQRSVVVCLLLTGIFENYPDCKLLSNRSFMGLP